MKKLWPYLLLNVVISAVTVLGVLLLWNASHPCVTSGMTGGTGSVANSSGNTQLTATLPPLDKTLFEVKTVIGAGDLENEHVHLLYLGSDALDLHNWTFWSGKKQLYIFPAFVLFKGGALDLYSKGGTNSAIELYMGSTSAYWNSGAKLILRDPQGNTRLEYMLP